MVPKPRRPASIRSSVTHLALLARRWCFRGSTKFKKIAITNPLLVLGDWSIFYFTAIAAKKLLSGPLILSSSRDRMRENGNKKARFSFTVNKQLIHSVFEMCHLPITSRLMV
jgi:hypothetical protein